MNQITIQANQSFLEKVVEVIKDLAKKENESVNFTEFEPNFSDENALENDGFSKDDEMKFRADLEAYYKGEMKFISFEESKARSEEFLKSLGAKI